MLFQKFANIFFLESSEISLHFLFLEDAYFVEKQPGPIALSGVGVVFEAVFYPFENIFFESVIGYTFKLHV